MRGGIKTKKNKLIGIVFIVLACLVVVGGIGNGTFADMGNQNIGFIIGCFGALIAFFVIGILSLISKKGEK